MGAAEQSVVQGIEASASSSQKKQGSGSYGGYNGPVYTYEPIPGNAVADMTPYLQNGYIVKPYGPIATKPVCPPGQTGYWVWDQNGNWLYDTFANPYAPGGHEGNFQAYEEDKHKRLGTDADRPHRIKYRKLTMG